MNGDGLKFRDPEAALAARALRARAAGVGGVGAVRGVWLRGVAVDGVEAVITVPILASLVLVAPQSELLVATVLAALLSALAIAQRRPIVDAMRYAAAAAAIKAERGEGWDGMPDPAAVEKLLQGEAR